MTSAAQPTTRRHARRRAERSRRRAAASKSSHAGGLVSNVALPVAMPSAQIARPGGQSDRSPRSRPRSITEPRCSTTSTAMATIEPARRRQPRTLGEHRARIEHASCPLPVAAGRSPRVALDDGYECHSCWPRTFAAGLVRVPRAWGDGRRGDGRGGAAAAAVPRGGRRRATTLDDQTAAAGRAARAPLVLGGCCCAHLGAIRGPRARATGASPSSGSTRTATSTRPETSPSGNAWGMPLRWRSTRATSRPHDVALVGARSLDPPELAYLESERDRRRRVARARGRDARLRRARLRRARPGELAVLHAGARRAVRRGGRADPARDRRSRRPARGARADRTRGPTPTSARCRASPAALGL